MAWTHIDLCRHWRLSPGRDAQRRPARYPHPPGSCARCATNSMGASARRRRVSSTSACAGMTRRRAVGYYGRDRIVVGVSMNWIIWFIVWILCWSGAMFVSKTLRRMFAEIRQKTNGLDIRTIEDIKRAGRGCYFRYMVALTFNLLLLATPIVWLLIMAFIKILD